MGGAEAPAEPASAHPDWAELTWVEVRLDAHKAAPSEAVLRAIHAIEGNQLTSGAVIGLLTAFCGASPADVGGMRVKVVRAAGSAQRTIVEIEMLALEEHSNGYAEDGGWFLDENVQASGESPFAGGASYSREAARDADTFAPLASVLRTALEPAAMRSVEIDLKLLATPPSGPLPKRVPIIAQGSTLPDDVVVPLGESMSPPDCIRLDEDMVTWRVPVPGQVSRRWRKDLRGGAIVADDRPIDPCDLLSASLRVSEDHADGAVVVLRPDGTRERVLVAAQPSGSRCRDTAQVREGTLYHSNRCVEEGVWAIDVATGTRARLTERTAVALVVTRDHLVWSEHDGAMSTIGTADVRAMRRAGGPTRSLTSEADRARSMWFGAPRATDSIALWVANGGMRSASLDGTPVSPMHDTAGAMGIVQIEGDSVLWLDRDGLHQSDFVRDRRLADWPLQWLSRAPQLPLAISDRWIAWVDPLRQLRARHRSRSRAK